MLLENPYLYFTEFDVKNNISKKRILEMDTSLRTIYIFDNNMFTQYQDIISLLLDKNVHVFVLINNEDKNGYDTYSMLGKNKLLVYKPNKLKMIQKRFYKYYIKPLYRDKQESAFSDFDSYYITVNNENLDLKYIIIRDDELRYN